MNDFKKLVILDLEDNIKRDVTNVDVDDILIRLISKNVINSEEQRAVLGGHNKISELIKILLSKTDGNWFEEFASALENDYRWISRNLRSRFDNEVTEKLDFYLHGRGNVPPLPQHNIRRKKYIQPLRDKIRNLKRNSYLVVHGLSGLGKTFLVVDALNDIGLLENSFNGCVYWMSVGDLRNEELDKIQCLQLQKKLCTMSNLVLNPQRDLSPDELLLELKRHFSVKPNNSSLLILDKVRCSKVIEILSVGCKILITSQDRDVVKDPYHRDFYEISEGFSEQESVQLLSDFVLDGTKELSPPIRECATKIHRMWKGHPMIIRLIGGELSETKEESQREVARWQVYEKTAQHGTNGNVSRRRSAHEEQVKDIIELTTKKLKSDFKNRFFMLAVLVEDANITKEVLKILWDVEIHEVEVTMNTFYRRSLVLRKYVDKLRQPVYGIHDIIMEYLKKSVSKSDLQNMHKDLMKKIYEFCNGDFSTLPEDSYIFSYLCHHVENANMWNTYRDQFFPIRYLERKLKATGSGDLLLDLHKYQSGLENNNEYYRSKIKDIKRLVNDSGWDIHQGDVDIVQCALLQPEKSYIHDEGTGIANNNESSKVYFYPTPTATEKKPRDLKGNFDNVQAVSLVASNSSNLADGRLLIYPDAQGLIAEIDMHFKGKRRSFRESSQVVMLKMSPLRDKFLSALDNGYINIWSMTSESTTSADTPPPSLKQKSHQPFFEDTRSTPCSSFKHKLRVICASFSSDGRLIVSSSADNVVCVWSMEENILLHELKLHPSPSATACTFVCNDTMIVYGCTDFHLYFFHLTHSQKFETKIDGNNGRLVSLFTTPGEGRKLIVVQEKSVVSMSWELERLTYRAQGHRELELKNLRPDILHNIVKPGKINCAAYHQNNLVLGTCHNGLILFDVLSHQLSYQILASEEIKAVDIVNSQVVLAQNKTVIMLWPEPNKKMVMEQVESANLGWNTSHQKPLTVHGIATSDGNIQVFHDGKMIVDKLYPNTCFVRLCEQSDNVLIGTSTGVVALLDTVSSSINTLFLLPSKITYLSVTMYQNNYGRDYVYLATAKETDNSEVLVLKARALKKKCKISAPVVKVFIHSQENFMIVILRDCSILAWDLRSGCDPTSVVQGRVSATITDASFSEEKSIIVLSDLENCFHQVHLQWPEKKKGAPLDSNNFNRLIISKTRDTDVVDGMGLSSPPTMGIVRGVFDTIPRSSQSWCCSMSPKGELVAIGHGECNVLVWDLKTKSTVFDFEVLPDRRRKVGQLQFSHNNVKMGKTQFELVLCVVTDCLSFYDLSSILNDNSRIGKKDSPDRIGCVTASGNDIVEFSANSCFSKFCAFDISYSFFSWHVYEKNLKDSVLKVT